MIAPHSLFSVNDDDDDDESPVPLTSMVERGLTSEGGRNNKRKRQSEENHSEGGDGIFFDLEAENESKEIERKREKKKRRDEVTVVIPVRNDEGQSEATKSRQELRGNLEAEVDTENAVRATKRARHRSRKSEQKRASVGSQSKEPSILIEDNGEDREGGNSSEDKPQELIITQVKQIGGQWVVQPKKVIVQPKKKIETPVPLPTLYRNDSSCNELLQKTKKTPNSCMEDPFPKYPAQDLTTPVQSSKPKSTESKNTSHSTSSITRKMQRDLERQQEIARTSKELEKVVANIAKSASNTIAPLVERLTPKTNVNKVSPERAILKRYEVAKWDSGKIKGARPGSSDEEIVENIAFSPAIASCSSGLTFTSASHKINIKTIIVKSTKAKIVLDLENAETGGTKVCTVLDGTIGVELGETVFDIKQGGVWRVRVGEACVMRLAGSSGVQGKVGVFTVT